METKKPNLSMVIILWMVRFYLFLLVLVPVYVIFHFARPLQKVPHIIAYITLKNVTITIIIITISHISFLSIYKHYTQKKWKKRWTVSLIVMMMVLLVSGIASIGIVAFGEIFATKGITVGDGMFQERDPYLSYFYYVRDLEQQDQDYQETLHRHARMFALKNRPKTKIMRTFVDNSEYMFAVSKDHSLGAVISSPISMEEIRPHRILVIFFRKGKSWPETYRHLSLEKIIRSIENGVVPNEPK